MPRWAARWVLRVDVLRVEPLQSMTSDDAFREGVVPCEDCHGSPWGRGAQDDPLSNAAGGRPWRECPGVCNGQNEMETAEMNWTQRYGTEGPYSWGSNPLTQVITFNVFYLDPR